MRCPVSPAASADTCTGKRNALPTTDRPVDPVDRDIMALTVLAAYDITQDRRRAKLAAVLQTWGDQIQYSVFICLITPEELPALVATVQKIIDPDEDSFFLVRQWPTLLGQHADPRPSPPHNPGTVLGGPITTTTIATS